MYLSSPLYFAYNLPLLDSLSSVFAFSQSGDNIEDNREKKASDDKFKMIPDFACSSYGSNNGCGWGGYIGSSNQDKAVPEEWL